MRLIDADALEESLENSCKGTYETKMFVDFMNYVDESPTIKQSENCISRETAIDQFIRWYSELILSQKEEVSFEDILKSLPSVTPSYNSINTELKPCEDCVKREDVRSEMIKYGFLSPDMTVTEFVEDLPSVTPSRPKGKWILTHPLQADDPGAYTCSVCGYGDWGLDPKIDKFCFNCGARMVESEERNDNT